jgi:hypothetical protein
MIGRYDPFGRAMLGRCAVADPHVGDGRKRTEPLTEPPVCLNVLGCRRCVTRRGHAVSSDGQTDFGPGEE